MVELLVPAEPHQLAFVGGDPSNYDAHVRPGLMVRAMEEFQQGGVEPTIWKVEGLDRTADCLRIAEVARRNGRANVACIVLGRNAADTRVERWLRAAAAVPAFIGFAVGRSTFADALLAWRAGRMTREQSAEEIALRYRRWTRIFVEERTRSAGSPEAKPS
jgi:myo-inositol catabolism protein IolC